MNKLLAAFANEKKLEALQIRFTADTIVKTPEMVFIRAFIRVHCKYCTSKYATNIKCLRTDWQPETEIILSSKTDTQNLQLIKQQIAKKYLELVAKNPNTTANELYLSLVGRESFENKHKKQTKKDIPSTKITNSVTEYMLT